jgi:AraC-like DNA-binding protein
MLSDRCKTIVSQEMKKLDLHCGIVHLGEVETASRLSGEERELLKVALMKSGLELMDDSVARLMDKIKTILKEMVCNAAERQKENFSNYLSEKTGSNYAYLSNLFSEVTGMTIEHYIITYKIELVKEYLLYDECSLSEISHKLNYSSSAHLSSQFKKMTGLTPSYFKKLKRIRRNALYVV